MHPNPIFHKTERARSIAFAQGRGFGVLGMSTAGAPHLSHVPFLLNNDGTEALLHLVRSNPIARDCAKAGNAARLDVLGPDGYVSPDWYADPDQVPTWNYVAVHLIGTLHPLPPDQLNDVLAAQSAAYEARLDKTPWTMDKMSNDAKARLMRQILPFRLEVTTLDATWKLNQNKAVAARLGASKHIASGLGHALDQLAALMRSPPDLDD